MAANLRGDTLPGRLWRRFRPVGEFERLIYIREFELLFYVFCKFLFCIAEFEFLLVPEFELRL